MPTTLLTDQLCPQCGAGHHAYDQSFRCDSRREFRCSLCGYTETLLWNEETKERECRKRGGHGAIHWYDDYEDGNIIRQMRSIEPGEDPERRLELLAKTSYIPFVGITEPDGNGGWRCRMIKGAPLIGFLLDSDGRRVERDPEWRKEGTPAADEG